MTHGSRHEKNYQRVGPSIGCRVHVLLFILAVGSGSGNTGTNSSWLPTYSNGCLTLHRIPSNLYLLQLGCVQCSLRKEHTHNTTLWCILGVMQCTTSGVMQYTTSGTLMFIDAFATGIRTLLLYGKTPSSCPIKQSCNQSIRSQHVSSPETRPGSSRCWLQFTEL